MRFQERQQVNQQQSSMNVDTLNGRAFLYEVDVNESIWINVNYVELFLINSEEFGKLHQ